MNYFSFMFKLYEIWSYGSLLSKGRAESMMGNHQVGSARQLLFCFLGETKSLYSLFSCQTLKSYILYGLVQHIFDF